MLTFETPCDVGFLTPRISFVASLYFDNPSAIMGQSTFDAVAVLLAGKNLMRNFVFER
jgi:hypothetical protein